MAKEASVQRPLDKVWSLEVYFLESKPGCSPRHGELQVLVCTLIIGPQWSGGSAHHSTDQAINSL